MHKDNLRMQQDMLNIISLLESNNADTIYYHQAMKDPDAN